MQGKTSPKHEVKNKPLCVGLKFNREGFFTKKLLNHQVSLDSQ